LWSHGISGDWPILLATIDSPVGLPSVRQLLRTHNYWRLKGITCDLVILNMHPVTYLQELNDELLTTVMASSEAGLLDRPGEVFNGIGGFNTDGEYEIRLTGAELPPAPWVNVIGNPAGGFCVSESGCGATWAGNSYFYRLTPWHNDPVRDPSSDCIYIRDDED